MQFSNIPLPFSSSFGSFEERRQEAFQRMTDPLRLAMINRMGASLGVGQYQDQLKKFQQQVYGSSPLGSMGSTSLQFPPMAGSMAAPVVESPTRPPTSREIIPFRQELSQRPDYRPPPMPQQQPNALTSNIPSLTFPNVGDQTENIKPQYQFIRNRQTGVVEAIPTTDIGYQTNVRPIDMGRGAGELQMGQSASGFGELNRKFASALATAGAGGAGAIDKPQERSKRVAELNSEINSIQRRLSQMDPDSQDFKYGDGPRLRNRLEMLLRQRDRLSY